MPSLKKVVLSTLAALAAREANSTTLYGIISNSEMTDLPFNLEGICNITSFPGHTAPLSILDEEYSLTNVNAQGFSLNLSSLINPSIYNGGNQSLIMDCDLPITNPMHIPWRESFSVSEIFAISANITPKNPIGCTLYNVQNDATQEDISVRVYAKNYTAANGGIESNEVITVPAGGNTSFVFKTNRDFTSEFMAISEKGLSNNVLVNCQQGY